MERYQVISKAGEGAHSVVYKAIDLRTGKFVALKVVSCAASVEKKGLLPIATIREHLCLSVISL